MDVFGIGYDEYRDWIRNSRKRGISWDDIALGLKKDERGLVEFLNRKVFEDGFCEITLEEWDAIVKSLKESEEKMIAFKDSKKSGIITNGADNNEFEVPKGNQTVWVNYRKMLKRKKFDEDAIAGIEDSAHRTLKRLSIDTRQIGSIKGMVVGNVQSGKTANMAGLIAMAADYGWNMFIVLSGTIDNLRIQTQERLINDLNYQDNCNISFQLLEHPSTSSGFVKESQLFNFNDGQSKRYFTVCLKNAKRLQALNDWLHHDENKYKNMKILIIDDEADQASVNTSNMYETLSIEEINDERKKINKLIIDLVEGTKNGYIKNKDFKAKAINYVSYTATPYANFLNESTIDSLYPRNFINFLDQTKEYFGPQEIFGVSGVEDYNGMDIVRNADDFDRKALKNATERNLNFSAPKSLEHSLLWFLCTAATMRHFQVNSLISRKPVTLLIHVSQRQADHNTIYHSLHNLLTSYKHNVSQTIEACKKVWMRETTALDKGKFIDSLPLYDYNSRKINDYPMFEEIEIYIEELLSKISYIKLDEQGNLNYHNGLHICVDNCANNMSRDSDDHVRLAYPSEIKDDNLAPAFIVIGGSTLSRGLTMEGLVSTYFLRTVKQADTLMQMGRWFGYRKGYELLPRIWMDSDAQEKFEFLSELDYELRSDLERFQNGCDPKEYGVNIKSTPKMSWLAITSKNKMQAAINANFDFSGYSTQTTLFSNNEESVATNLANLDVLIQKLDDFDVTHDGTSLCCRNVNFNEVIKPFLEVYQAPKETSFFHEIEQFTKWFEEINSSQEYDNWNIVFNGSGKINDQNPWVVKNYGLGLTNRSKLISEKNDEKNLIDIRILRSPIDLLADVPLEFASRVDFKGLSRNQKRITQEYKSYRKLVGLEKTPLLTIYRIKKDYKYLSNSNKINKTREDMCAVDDLVGLMITMPGQKINDNHVVTITIDLAKHKEFDYED
ncbi:Z1 domain-containing protein [Breznakia blatticola]|uniref:Z1 domain-containing protein n=1 Tax=Breznakia blatticola TaxID=1754012 RepID=A0A4R8A3B1_9FIRM|nr:Z1 domain-containing protein [Breznakia blatticola]TDW25067.1 Z1 domain-containing protein [Breznakia blatticola]